MFDNVLASGCSLCWGSELFDRSNRYSNQIANKFNAKLHDFSLGGIGNESISIRFIDGALKVLKQENFDPEKTLAIVSWTFFERINFFNPKNKKLVVLSNSPNEKRYTQTITFNESDKHLDFIDLDFYYKNHYDIAYLIYNSIKYIYMTQMFLEKHKIKYVFTFPNKFYDRIIRKNNFEISYFGEDNDNRLPSFINWIDQIDKNKFYDTFICNFAEDNKYPIGEKRHPLDKAHLEYSKGLSTFVENTYGN